MDFYTTFKQPSNAIKNVVYETNRVHPSDRRHLSERNIHISNSHQRRENEGNRITLEESSKQKSTMVQMTLLDLDDSTVQVEDAVTIEENDTMRIHVGKPISNSETIAHSSLDDSIDDFFSLLPSYQTKIHSTKDSQSKFDIKGEDTLHTALTAEPIVVTNDTHVNRFDGDIFDSTPSPTYSSFEPTFTKSKRKASSQSIILDSVIVPEEFGATRFTRQPLLLEPKIQNFDSPDRPRRIVQIPTSDSVNIDSDLFAGNLLKVKIITFNMNGKTFSNTKEQLGFMKPNSYHIYVFASQECERSIEKSFFNESKRKWMGLLSEVFSNEYEIVTSVSQMAMHLIVLVKKPLHVYIGRITSQKISCGWGNRIGNKGAVAISFMFGYTRFMFINCHMAAHQNNLEQRIQDYHTIMRKLAYENKSRVDERREVDSGMPPYAVFDDFDYVFFAGDTNFRTDASREQVDYWIANFDRYKSKLLEHDQLKRAKGAGFIFEHFEEGEINFLPTFKFDKQSDVYDSSEKRRIPSYTDRILYYGNPKRDTELFLQDYNVGKCTLSDHKPVIGKFLVKVNLMND